MLKYVTHLVLAFAPISLICCFGCEPQGVGPDDLRRQAIKELKLSELGPLKPEYVLNETYYVGIGKNSRGEIVKVMAVPFDRLIEYISYEYKDGKRGEQLERRQRRR